MAICYRFAASGKCRFGEDCRYEHVRTAHGSRATRPRRRHSENNAASSGNHIAQFFEAYPEYDYDPTSSFTDEFQNLSQQFNWEPNSKDEREAKGHLQDAVALQFNGMYGTAVNDLGAWQALCHALEIAPVPNRLWECRELVLQTHVNICDLVEAPTLGPPQAFPTVQELADYTKKTGKIYPRSNIHAGSLLRFLLRPIF